MELYLRSANTPSWRGAQLKAQGQLYLFVYYAQMGHVSVSQSQCNYRIWKP
jgi:hypothetical protein